jgi:hypothetical protein
VDAPIQVDAHPYPSDRICQNSLIEQGRVFTLRALRRGEYLEKIAFPWHYGTYEESENKS